MATLNWIVLTAQQRADAEALNDESYVFGARLIDNPVADTLGHGTLVGKYAADAVLLENEGYERWFESLSSLPIYEMDSGSIFIPPPVDA